MFLEAMLLGPVLKQPVQFMRCPTYKNIHYRELGLREVAVQAGESPIPASSTRLARPGPVSPHPVHRDRPPASPGASLTAPALSPASLQTAIFPRGGGQVRERARSNLPPLPGAPCPRCPISAQRRGFCGPWNAAEPLATQQARSTARAARTPGEGGPEARGSGRAEELRAARELAARGGRGAGRLSPHLRAAEPAPLEQYGGEEHGGGSRSPRRGRPGRLPVSRQGAGRAGWPGEGEKGRGRGRGKGEPLCGVASELLPPPPRPPPPFRFTQTNKMAAVTARLFRPPKSLVQIGRMFTVKKVLVRLRNPPEPQKGRRRRADHFLVFGPSAYRKWSRRKGSSKRFFGASELANTAHAQHIVTTWVLT